jgi:hypothetical protein
VSHWASNYPQREQVVARRLMGYGQHRRRVLEGRRLRWPNSRWHLTDCLEVSSRMSGWNQARVVAALALEQKASTHLTGLNSLNSQNAT